MKNWIITALGLLSFALAMIGVVVPGLPTTPFLILSSVLFCKSHPRLYHWLVSHPRWGRTIRQFNEQRVIPLPIKLIALSMMSVMILVSVLFFMTNPWLRAGVIVLGLIGSAVVLSFPSRPPSP
jgi:uncharacterized membrane protein YbaN (DUF454 family)